MIRFLLRRIGLAVPTLLGVSIVIFVTIRIVPGDPVASLLGPTGSAEARERLTKDLGLDAPIPVQYVKWLGNVVQGDLGRSIAKQTDALPYVWEAFRNTLTLSIFAALVAILGGIALGVLAATRRGRVASGFSTAVSLFSISAPQYSVGLILIVYLSAGRGWFPSGGMRNPTGDSGFGDLLNHLWLPGISAALVPLGIIARMVRSSMLDALSADFVESLRARGIPEWKVRWHAFHNALPSVLTIAGLQVGYLLGGVIFVEIVFSWPGLGLVVFQSISQRDLPVIQAGVLVSALAFVVINLIVDALHGLMDPRIRR
ncbi:MAG: ABC transporter permease [Acidimicrobiales bacterium]|nr:ABC transporter permease [Acidimicrobiales bacterium]